MKIKIFLGYKNKNGAYVDIKSIDEVSKDEASKYMNEIQVQFATAIGYEKGKDMRR